LKLFQRIGQLDRLRAVTANAISYRDDGLVRPDQIKTLRTECIDDQSQGRCGNSDKQRLPAGFRKGMWGLVF